MENISIILVVNILLRKSDIDLFKIIYYKLKNSVVKYIEFGIICGVIRVKSIIVGRNIRQVIAQCWLTHGLTDDIINNYAACEISGC